MSSIKLKFCDVEIEATDDKLSADKLGELGLGMLSFLIEQRLKAAEVLQFGNDDEAEITEQRPENVQKPKAETLFATVYA